MLTSEHTMRECVGSLCLDITTEIRLDTQEITSFTIFDGPSNVTTFVREMNFELYERLKEKGRAELIEMNKPEGADL